MSINPTKILLLMKTTTDAYNMVLSKAADELKISKQEADVLLFLGNNPMFHTAKEITEYRGISKAYVSKAVDQLVQKGYLIVSAVMGDRRIQNLTITELAMPIVGQLQRKQEEYLQVLGQGISKEECDLFLDICQRFGENAKQLK